MKYSLKDLPDELPLFPLPGALLLPKSKLPLNLFEPKYLAMLNDVLKTENRLIGMIQPMTTPQGATSSRKLHQIGCAGRIVSFNENKDGRYLITLEGVSRYRFKELTNGLGADVIYDAVGGDIFLQCMRCVNWKGRVLVIGFPAGIPKVPTNLALLKGCSIVGVFWGSFTGREPEENNKNFEELFALHSDGKLKPEITKSYSLDQAVEAIKSLEDRTATGKVVVEI